MKIKFKILNSLKTRILLIFSVVSFIILFVFSIFFIKFNVNHIFELERNKIENKTSEITNLISSFINSQIATSKSVADYFENYSFIEEKNRRIFYNNLLKKMIIKNNNISAIWVKFKPYSIDKLDTVFEDNLHGISGQYIKSYYRYKNQVYEKKRTPQDEVEFNNFIENIHKNKKAYIIAPVINNYHIFTFDTTYLIRIIIPIYNNTEFIGITGIDINLSEITKFFPTEKDNIYILSDEKKFIYHPNKNLQNKLLTNIYPKFIEDYHFLQNIKKGKKFILEGKFFDDSENDFYAFNSIKITNTNIIWNIIFSSPVKIIKNKNNNWILLFIILVVILFFVLHIIPFLVSKYLISKLKQIFNFIQNISEGNIKKDAKLSVGTSKELKEISQYSLALNNDLLETANFVNNIKNDNFQLDFKPHGKNDLLRKLLIDLRDKLLENKDLSKKMIKKQEIENWYNIGITKFSDIVRENNELEIFAYKAISNLTDYINGVQGGFFTINEENQNNKYLELISFYSYNRKIYHSKRIDIGDGLVGTCALEQKIIHIKVPDNYLEITSGLGKAKPNFALLCPIIHNDILFGVIEIASLNEFKKFQIKFVKEISETIGASLSSRHISQKTVKLLEEQTKQSDIMITKEIELKEKILQLEKLQDEAKKTKNQMTGIINSLNEVGHTAEFDIKTKLISINEKLLKILKTTYQEATIKNYFELFYIDIDILDEHKNYWKKIEQGQIVTFILKTKIAGNNIWLNVILSPIYNEFNEIIKALFIAFDYTKIREQKIEIDKLVEETQEKAEQINYQEKEMEFTFAELEGLYKEIKNQDAEIRELKKTNNKNKKTAEFFKKELEKRLKRFKKVETNLKEKIKKMENK